MSDDQEIKDNLKKVISLGLSLETISATIAYGIKNNKSSFVENLSKLLKEFKDSLSDDEKKDLEEDIAMSASKKTDELLDKLEEELSDEEIEEMLDSLDK